jgi:25S rRNA (adenine2142-N1)-methyltransferase
MTLMNTVGFWMVRERWKAGGKVGYWLFEKEIPRVIPTLSSPRENAPKFTKKVVLREGANRNNFCILLQ